MFAFIVQTFIYFITLEIPLAVFSQDEDVKGAPRDVREAPRRKVQNVLVEDNLESLKAPSMDIVEQATNDHPAKPFRPALHGSGPEENNAIAQQRTVEQQPFDSRNGIIIQNGNAQLSSVISPTRSS